MGIDSFEMPGDANIYTEEWDVNRDGAASAFLVAERAPTSLVLRRMSFSLARGAANCTSTTPTRR